MRYTLEQACERLSNYQHAYGVTDVKTAINGAIQALSGLNGWECLRRVVRFASAGPVFALPQGCAGLVRACINGRPATMRGQDFQFLQSGPGDVMAQPPRGFVPVLSRNIESEGEKPVIFEPIGPFRLVAFADATPEPAISVKGLDRTGRIVKCRLPMHGYAEYDPVSGDLTSGSEPEDTEPDSPELVQILEVALDKCATKYAALFARCEDGSTVRLAVYHPAVRAPCFQHYRVSGYPPDMPVEILAEVRIDPLPLIEDDDVLPFSSLEPIEYMILYNWKMQSSEIDAARKYKEEAAAWMKSQELAADAVQTQLVVNGVVAGSMGEVSMEAANI